MRVFFLLLVATGWSCAQTVTWTTGFEIVEGFPAALHSAPHEDEIKAERWDFISNGVAIAFRQFELSPDDPGTPDQTLRVEDEDDSNWVRFRLYDVTSLSFHGRSNLGFIVKVESLPASLDPEASGQPWVCLDTISFTGSGTTFVYKSVDVSQLGPGAVYVRFKVEQHSGSVFLDDWNVVQGTPPPIPRAEVTVVDGPTPEDTRQTIQTELNLAAGRFEGTNLTLNLAQPEVAFAGAEDAALVARGVTDLTIRGPSELRFMSLERAGIEFRNCERVAVENLTLDWVGRAFMQGNIKSFGLQMANGLWPVSISVDPDYQSAPIVELFNSYRTHVMAYDRRLDIVKDGARQLETDENQSTAILVGGVLTVELTEDPTQRGYALGDRCVAKASIASKFSTSATAPLNACAIQFMDCKDVSVDGVTIHHAPGSAVESRRCSGVTYRDVDVVPRPGLYEDALLTHNRDGLRVYQARSDGPVIIEGCEVTRGGDDLVAVTSHYHPVIGSVSGGSVPTSMKTNSRSGDIIRFYDGSTLESFPSIPPLAIQTITRPIGGPIFFGFGSAQLLGLEVGDLMFAPNSCALDVTIRNNVLTHGWARGANFSGREMRVLENQVAFTGGPGLMLGTSITSFDGIAPWAEGLEVRGNVVERCGFGLSFANPGSTRLGGINVALTHQRATWPAVHHHTDLLIVDNVVRDVPAAGVFLTCASGFLIRGNRVYDSHQHPDAFNLGNSRGLPAGEMDACLRAHEVQASAAMSAEVSHNICEVPTIGTAPNEITGVGVRVTGAPPPPLVVNNIAPAQIATPAEHKHGFNPIDAQGWPADVTGYEFWQPNGWTLGNGWFGDGFGLKNTSGFGNGWGGGDDYAAVVRYNSSACEVAILTAPLQSRLRKVRFRTKRTGGAVGIDYTVRLQTARSVTGPWADRWIMIDDEDTSAFTEREVHLQDLGDRWVRWRFDGPGAAASAGWFVLDDVEFVLEPVKFEATDRPGWPVTSDGAFAELGIGGEGWPHAGWSSSGFGFVNDPALGYGVMADVSVATNPQLISQRMANARRIDFDLKAPGTANCDVNVYLAASPDPATWALLATHTATPTTTRVGAVVFVSEPWTTGSFVIEVVADPGSTGVTCFVDNVSF